MFLDSLRTMLSVTYNMNLMDGFVNGGGSMFLW